MHGIYNNPKEWHPSKNRGHEPCSTLTTVTFFSRPSHTNNKVKTKPPLPVDHYFSFVTYNILNRAQTQTINSAIREIGK